MWMEAQNKCVDLIWNAMEIRQLNWLTVVIQQRRRLQITRQ